MSEVSISNVESQLVLGMRKRGTYAEIRPMIAKIHKYIESRGAQIAGPPIFVCHETPKEVVKVNLQHNADVEVVIPVSLTYFAMDGCAEILETVGKVRERFGRENLAVSLVVPALYRRTRLADAILDRLGEHFPRNLSRTVIGYDVKVDEAQSHGLTIWEYAPTSRGAEMFTRLAMEVERWPARL